MTSLITEHIAHENMVAACVAWYRAGAPTQPQDNVTHPYHRLIVAERSYRTLLLARGYTDADINHQMASIYREAKVAKKEAS